MAQDSDSLALCFYTVLKEYKRAQSVCWLVSLQNDLALAFCIFQFSVGKTKANCLYRAQLQ